LSARPLLLSVEPKLASGMTAPHRLKDLADVQELIRIQRLPKAFALEINAYLRDKYLELWQAVQDYPDEAVEDPEPVLGSTVNLRAVQKSAVRLRVPCLL